MILTKHFMMTARLECTDRWPAPHLYFKRLSHPRLVGIRWCHTQTCPQQAGMSEKGEKSKKLPVVYFPQQILCFLSYNYSFVHRPIPSNAFKLLEKREFLRALCHRLWRKGAHLPLSRHPSERSGWDTQ